MLCLTGHQKTHRSRDITSCPLGKRERVWPCGLMTRMWSGRHSRTLTAGALFGAVALERGVGAPRKTADAHVCWALPLLRVCLEEPPHMCWGHMYKSAHFYIVHDMKNLKQSNCFSEGKRLNHMCSSFYAVMKMSESDLYVLMWINFRNTMLRKKTRCGLTQSDPFTQCLKTCKLIPHAV